MSDSLPSDAPPPVAGTPKPTPKTLRQQQASRMIEFQRSLAPYTPRVYVTWLLIGVNVAVWLAMIATGVKPFAPVTADLLRWGADYAPLSTHGQWWRAFTCMFLHAGLLHLAMNMIVLFSIGPFMERLLGNGGFLVLYIVAGLAGSLLSMAHSAMVVSVGASGAIFGLYGALIGFLLRARGTLPKDIFQQLLRMAGAFVLYNIIFAAGIKAVDQSAHFGGLIGGFLGGVVLGHPLDAGGFSARARRGAILAVLGAGLFAALMMSMPKYADLLGEIDSFGVVETRLLGVVNGMVERKVDNRELTNTLQHDVLPEWRQRIDRMRALAPLDRHQVGLRDRLVDYMQARADAWQLAVDAMNKNDPTLMEQARARQKQADELIKKIAE